MTYLEILDRIGKRCEKRDGETRWYINDWEDAFGLEIDYYKGLTVGVYYNGRKRALPPRKIQNVKVWVDKTGEVHVDHCSVHTLADVITQAIGKKIEEMKKEEMDRAVEMPCKGTMRVSPHCFDCPDNPCFAYAKVLDTLKKRVELDEI